VRIRLMLIFVLALCFGLSSSALAADSQLTFVPSLDYTPENVVTDAAGNLYVTGTFSGTMDFNPLPGTDTKTSHGFDDVFITKFNADLTYGWTTIFGGTYGDYARDLIEVGGVIYVCGSFSSPDAHFDNLGAIGSLGPESAFVVAVNASNGVPITSFGTNGIQRIGGNSNVTGECLTASGSHVYVGGHFTGGEFGIGALGSTSAVGLYDSFVCALNRSNGAAATGFGTGGIKKFGGSQYEYTDGITLSNGVLYVSGSFNSNNAGFGSAGTITSLSSGKFSLYLLALNATNGAPVSTFGSGGVQRIGGSQHDYGGPLVVSGSTLYATGKLNSTNAGVGSFGNIKSSGSTDVFVVALNSASGSLVSSFGSGGAVVFGGSGNDTRPVIAILNSTLYLGGLLRSTDAGFNGLGTISMNTGNAFVGALNLTTGAPITSFGTQGVKNFGSNFDGECRGVATHGSTVYMTGYSKFATVRMSGITSFATLGGFLLPTPAVSPNSSPYITSPLAAIGGIGADFSYQITAANNPTSFGATNLPAGLTFSNNVLSGKPTISGRHVITVTATNSSGTGSANLIVHIGGDRVAPDPVVQGYSLKGVGVDLAGNRYLVGGFNNARDFNPGAGTDYRACLGYNNAFITRINANGTYGWTTIFGGSGYDLANSIIVTDATLFVTGMTSSTNSGFNGFGTISRVDNFSAFIASLDSSTGLPHANFGNGGAQIFGGSDRTEGRALCVSESTLFVTGLTYATDAGLNAAGNWASAGQSDMFVLSLDKNNGSIRTNFANSGVQIFGGTYYEEGNALTVLNNTLFVGGMFRSDNAGFGGIGTFDSNGNDAFVMALDKTAGTPLTGFGTNGIQIFGGSGSEYTYGLATSGSAIYACGYFQSYDAKLGGLATIPSSGDADAFVIGLNSVSGAALPGFGTNGVCKFGGTADDFGYAIISNNSKLYVSGMHYSSNSGIGGTGSIASVDGDAFVFAVDGATGQADSSFGIGGVVTFGGSGFDEATCITNDNSNIIIGGTFGSFDAGVNGIGSIDGTGLNGFALKLSNSGKIVPLIRWPNPPDLPFNTPLGASHLNASTSIAGTFAYTPAAGTFLSIGNSQTLSVTFTPQDTAKYASVNLSVTINVIKATPVINWANPSAIIYGTPLSATQLNAATALPGTFAYSPPLGTVLLGGNAQPLSVTFYPDDTAMYFNSTKTVYINVNKAPATVTFNNLTAVYDGSGKSAGVFTTPSGLGVLFTFNGSSAPPVNAGSYNVVATINDVSYQGSASGTFVIEKAPPGLAWLNPSSVTYPAPLGSPTLNATAITPGTFIYTPPAGTVLEIGTGYVLSVQFQPSSSNYTTAQSSVSINVLKASEFISAPTADTTTSFVDSLVNFYAPVDVFGGVATWIWDFGDGTSMVGNTPNISHAFNPAGQYLVTLTVQNGAGGELVATLNQTVLPVEVGGTPGVPGTGEFDSDNDGFSDALEVAYGSNQLSKSSSPVFTAPALPLVVTKLSTRLNFARPDRDAISVSGTLPISAGYAVGGQRFGIKIGAVPVVFILTSRGSAKTSDGTMKLSLKSKQRVVITQDAKFKVSIKGNFAAGLRMYGMKGDLDVKDVQLSLPVTVVTQTALYQAVVPQVFSAKTNKTGKSK
jgi:hypothetical protein